MPILRGLEARQEQDPGKLIRDTRTWSQRIADFFKSPFAVGISLFVLGIGNIFLPGISDISFILGISMFFIAFSRKAELPFRLPKHAKCKDYGNLKPGTRKPSEASGIYFFGNENKTNSELWFSNEDMRTHVLIFGSTGSGKTEFLVALAYNALCQASGFIYVDGKGDNSLFAKVFSMVRTMGREDDLLLINFMTGARDIIGPQPSRLSNTLNPFATGSSSMLAQLVVSLMDESAQTPDGDMWKGRAIAFVEALMKILVAMRDAGHILLDANTVRNYFHLDRLEAMVLDKVFVRDGQESISLEGVPEVVLEPITNYLITLPGYNKEKKGKQVSQVLEQHGFITMQLVRVFTSLADTYGHILRTKLAEVDLPDVVLNRRVLVVLLPALEKSPDELANLGKVVIATLKAMMASGLGEIVEGDYQDVVQRKPTNAKTPYLCILDEYGYYSVEGFAVVPAQARSLGFSVVFAGQDLPAFQKSSKEEAMSIGANTNIKIIMKLEDPLETWEFVQKTAGEAYVTHTAGFQTNVRSMSNTYLDNQSAQLEKRARVDLMDLKDQREGDMTIFFRAKIIRARTFYPDPQPVKKMRLNHFLKVDVPPDELVNKLIKGFNQFEKVIKSGDIFVESPKETNEELKIVVGKMSEDTSLPPIERGVSALLAYHNRDAPVKPHVEQKQLEKTELNVFMPLRLTDEMKNLLLIKDVNKFSQSLLEHAKTREQIEVLGRVSGKSEQNAANTAGELVKDMELATHYPPSVGNRPTSGQLAIVIDNLIDAIKVKKEEKKKEEDKK